MFKDSDLSYFVPWWFNDCTKLKRTKHARTGKSRLYEGILRPGIRFFEKDRKRNALLIKTGSPYGQTMTNAFKNAFPGMGGNVIKELTVNEENKYFKNLVGVFSGNFDLVFYGGTYEGTPLLIALREAARSWKKLLSKLLFFAE